MIGQYPENFREQCCKELIKLFGDYARDIITLNAYNGMVFDMYQGWKAGRAEYIPAEGRK